MGEKKFILSFMTYPRSSSLTGMPDPAKVSRHRSWRALFFSSSVLLPSRMICLLLSTSSWRCCRKRARWGSISSKSAHVSTPANQPGAHGLGGSAESISSLDDSLLPSMARSEMSSLMLSRDASECCCGVSAKNTSESRGEV